VVTSTAALDHAIAISRDKSSSVIANSTTRRRAVIILNLVPRITNEVTSRRVLEESPSQTIRFMESMV
jgi:hypothetical protein